MAGATEAAFQAGAGVGADTVNVLVTSVGCSLAVIWLVWLVISAFRGWTTGRVSEFTLFWSLIRGAMVLVILLWLLL
ncbi:TIGR03758 family integrating conjugative element protein [Salinicola endophyticus]|uniref:TIGR03758 family integrating conjugative element protein n=1 Tax=Salinicola endophyticus TaxID=1949083 RepID=A0AB74UFX2_9GAMM